MRVLKNKYIDFRDFNPPPFCSKWNYRIRFKLFRSWNNIKLIYALIVVALYAGLGILALKIIEHEEKTNSAEGQDI